MQAIFIDIEAESKHFAVATKALSTGQYYADNDDDASILCQQ